MAFATIASVYAGKPLVHIPPYTALLSMLVASLSASLLATALMSLRFYLLWRREWAMIRAGHGHNPAMNSWRINAFVVESGLPLILTGTLAAGTTYAICARRANMSSTEEFHLEGLFFEGFDGRATGLLITYMQGVWPSIMVSIFTRHDVHWKLNQRPRCVPRRL
jgi:uncharacterized membrane protein YecN with MAPEG domain